MPYLATKLEHQMYKEGANLIPAWSLTALLILMPYRTEILKKEPFGKIMKRDMWDGEFCFICYPKGLEKNKHLSGYHYNPIDAAFETICWLIEQEHIKVNK